jgi:hypothetical protein
MMYHSRIQQSGFVGLVCADEGAVNVDFVWIECQLVRIEELEEHQEHHPHREHFRHLGVAMGGRYSINAEMVADTRHWPCWP